MKSVALRLMGKRLVNRALLPRKPWSQRLNPLRGMRMMLDIDVPFRWKLLAYMAGVLLTALLELLEMPLTFADLLIPGGIVLNLLIEGGEALIIPIWLACVLLPRFYRPPQTDEV